MEEVPIFAEINSGTAAAELKAHMLLVQKYFTQRDVDEALACDNSPAGIKWHEVRPQFENDMRMADEKWKENIMQQLNSPVSVDGQAEPPSAKPPSAETSAKESVQQLLAISTYS